MKDSIRSMCRLVCAAAVTLFAGAAFSDAILTDGLLGGVDVFRRQVAHL